MPNNNIPSVFISYSRKDKKWVERLRVFLTPLSYDFNIDFWDDSRINPGMRWKDEIERALESAQVAILLVSGDFMASEFIRTIELPRLLNAAENRGLLVLPIILSKSSFDRTPELNQFQAVNAEKPLKSLREYEQDEVLDEVAEIIETNFERNRIMPDIVPTPQPVEMSNALQDLLMQFLKEYNSWYFNATRIRNWGAKQPGFERLLNYSTREIRNALELLFEKGLIKSKKGKKGSTIYKVK